MKLTKFQKACIRWEYDLEARNRGGFWITLLVYAVLFVLSDLLRPKPELENAKPSGLGDFKFPTATEQRVVPLVWGTVRIEGPNVVWWGDLIQEAITEKVKTGLFSSETVTKGFRYFVGIQSALCMGPVDDLTRVWIGDDLVLDELAGTPIVGQGTFTINEPDLFGGEELGQGGVVGTLRFFDGSDPQTVSTYLSAFQKEPAVTGDTPAYHDICYTAPNADPILVGTSASIKAWKWEVRRFPNGLALTGGHEVVAGGANLAAVVYEALTDDDWGYGIAAADIDVAQFRTQGDTMEAEGNGFSFILDRNEDTGDLIRRLEQQGEFIVFVNPLTALWQIKLIRADYDILLVPEINATNLVNVQTFTRATWEGTTNQVRVPFNQQNDEYKGTYGFAQDMANVRILGANVSTQVVHPGVKDATLANSIAWRELRTLAIPLAQGVFVVDRSLFGVLPGDVVGFTDADIGFDRLPMRIKSVNYGDLLEGKITIEAVQDVFFAAAGTFDDPPGTGWVPPLDVLVDYPAAARDVFEAPRALTARDPLSVSSEVDKIYAAARKQGAEVQYRMLERHAPGVPAGAFTEMGQVFQFMLIGELVSALNLSATNPLTTLLVDATPDSQAALVAAFPTVLNVVELGTDLLSLIKIDDEFLLVTSAQTSAGDVQLNTVYRGVLDSVQADHASAAEVYCLFVGGGISDVALPAGDNVDVKLIPRSISAELAEGSATTIAVALDNRVRRPYPPSEYDINGTTLDTLNVNPRGSGSGEDVGILVDTVIRRDFRVADGGDEIPPLSIDAATLDATFPAANSTEIDGEVQQTPGGTVLASETGVTGTAFSVFRFLDVLASLDTTSLPASLSIAVRQSHTFGVTVFKSLADLIVTFTVSDPFVGKHAFGELDDSEISNTFTVVAPTVDHIFNLSTSFTVGDVEYRINGGSWLTLIAAGGTGPGTIPNASLSASDTIEVRHLSTDTNPQKLLTMTVSAVAEAYAVMIS